MTKEFESKLIGKITKLYFRLELVPSFSILYCSVFLNAIQFHTKEKTHVLSFVDYRRFGSWKLNGDWGKDRGPDPVTHYQVITFKEALSSKISVITVEPKLKN